MRFLILLTLLSCGRSNETTAPASSLPILDDSHEFTLIKETFYHEAYRFNVTPGASSVVWGETIQGAAAQCNTGSKTITVNKASWLTMTPIQKEFVIFHEMGHCALGRSDHVTAYPSLMNAALYLGKISFYESNRDRYLEELFTKRNTL